MKIIFKTSDRAQASAQLRAFTKRANANLDLRKETSEIGWLTKTVTAPRCALQYKSTLGERDYFFNVALLVITEYNAVSILGANNFSVWYERREKKNRKMSFCVVIYNDEGEYILADSSDLTAADAKDLFNEVEKKRAH